MSIRWRLTLWYVLVLMLMLLAFTVVVYAGGTVLLRQSSDRDLLVRARLLADDLARNQEPTVLDTPYRVLTLNGRVARNSGLPQWRVPIHAAALAAANRDRIFTETEIAQPQAPSAASAAAAPAQGSGLLARLRDRLLGTQTGSAAAGQFVRVLSVPLGTPPRYILQVGEVQREERGFTGLLLLALAAVLLLGLPLAGLGGWWLAGRALGPVKAMAATARRIESTNLDERLRQSQDELGELASTFNQLLDRLQAAFQRERRFIADVSHDLRTPLALAKSTIGVALNRPRRADELREVLGDVDVQIDRVTSLLEATLFLSRADSEQMEQGFEPVDLTELLADLHETTALYAQTEHDQTVTSFVAPNLCVRGDRDQLTRLFLNLLDNAMQYTPAGGTIRLNAAAAGAVAQISLQDNGVGIAPEDLGHVFDRFFRADAARASTNGHHHGLGLSIAQAIASAHKGKISVASTLGKGTTFTVELPLGTGCPAGRPSSTAGARATSSNQVVQQPDAIA